jgi:hypothetical protein
LWDEDISEERYSRNLKSIKFPKELPLNLRFAGLISFCLSIPYDNVDTLPIVCWPLNSRFRAVRFTFAMARRSTYNFKVGYFDTLRFTVKVTETEKKNS